MTWRVPTLADLEGVVRRFRCGCGRAVWSDSAVDLAALPPGKRPRGERHVCDGCWQVMDHDNARRHEILQALGAPKAEVDRMAAKQGRRG